MATRSEMCKQALELQWLEQTSREVPDLESEQQIVDALASANWSKNGVGADCAVAMAVHARTANADDNRRPYRAENSGRLSARDTNNWRIAMMNTTTRTAGIVAVVMATFTVTCNETNEIVEATQAVAPAAEAIETQAAPAQIAKTTAPQAAATQARVWAPTAEAPAPATTTTVARPRFTRTDMEWIRTDSCPLRPVKDQLACLQAKNTFQTWKYETAEVGSKQEERFASWADHTSQRIERLMTSRAYAKASPRRSFRNAGRPAAVARASQAQSLYTETDDDNSQQPTTVMAGDPQVGEANAAVPSARDDLSPDFVQDMMFCAKESARRYAEVVKLLDWTEFNADIGKTYVCQPYSHMLQVVDTDDGETARWGKIQGRYTYLVTESLPGIALEEWINWHWPTTEPTPPPPSPNPPPDAGRRKTTISTAHAEE